MGRDEYVLGAQHRHGHGLETVPEGDPLKYTVTGGPTKGVVKVDALTGAFTYTPSVDARYTALVTPGDDTDMFTVTVNDGLGHDDHHGVARGRAARGERSGSAGHGHCHSRARYVVLLAGRDRHAFDALQAVGVTDIRVLIRGRRSSPCRVWATGARWTEW